MTNFKTNTSIMAIMTILTAASVNAQSPLENRDPDTPLRMHILRQVEIEDSVINLGQISVMQGPQVLKSRAEKITLGRISLPQQKVIINKSTIISRLACSGIPPSRYKLTGAVQTSVTRQLKTIESNQLVKIARRFIENKLPAGSVCKLVTERKPDDLLLPEECNDVELYPKLVARQPNVVKIRIMQKQQDKQSVVGDVVFRLKHNCKKAVTKTDIPAGKTITTKNTELKQTISEYPQPEDWFNPFGFVTRYPVPADTEIHPNMIAPQQEPVIIKRRQSVIIRVKRPGLLITVTGQALEQGRIGQQIKVRNVDSNRVIIAKVNQDGTVEPIL